MADLEKYRRFSEMETKMPLFSKGWWMDTVCLNEWDVILIEENGKIIASLPFYKQIQNGQLTIQKAPLTQTNGIWIYYPPNQKYEKRLSYEKKIMNEVIDEIEKLNIKKYQQYFHYSITNWLPFYWRGFSQTTRYTYVIENNLDLDEIYKNFNSNVRKLIRKAKKKVVVKENLDIFQFYTLNQMTYERQNLKTPYTLDIVLRIHKECLERNAGKILYCIDQQNNIHSAAYFVWDDESVYYLMSGSDPAFRSSQSLTLLLYEGIKLANNMGKKFDFEGSMKENIEHHFRQFGAKQIPYHNIYKTF